MRTLVIDIGTSGVRAAVIEDSTEIVALRHIEAPPSSPAPGLVEFDPVAMWRAVEDCVASVVGDAPIDSVGITNQRASVVGWHRTTGEPVAPGIGWQDLRTVGECLVARATHGLPLAPNQSATKIAWMRANVDGARDDDVVFGTVDSWIAWNLSRGAVHATDHTNAGVTGLTVADATAWDSAVLAALDIPTEVLPRIVHTSGVVGEAGALAGSPPIAALVGDQQASLVGQGCLTPGTAKATFGTGGMLDLFVGARPPEAARRSGHGTFPIVAHSSATSGLAYGAEAVMLSAGTCIEWLRDDLGLIGSAAESDAVAAQVASSDGVVFVPALLGLGTPHWDYGARGSLFGITRGTSSAHIVRAVSDHPAVPRVEPSQRLEERRRIRLSDRHRVAADHDRHMRAPAERVDDAFGRRKRLVGHDRDAEPAALRVGEGRGRAGERHRVVDADALVDRAEPRHRRIGEGVALARVGFAGESAEASGDRAFDERPRAVPDPGRDLVARPHR